MAGPRCPACTPSASAPAPACTEPTGSPRTRSPSASCSAPARPARRCAEPPAGDIPAGAGRHRIGSPVPSPASREALWTNAGIERDQDGLTALSADPHPLVRLIAACALAREESRGAHRRRDFPELDHEPRRQACDGRPPTASRRCRPGSEALHRPPPARRRPPRGPQTRLQLNFLINRASWASYTRGTPRRANTDAPWQGNRKEWCACTGSVERFTESSLTR